MNIMAIYAVVITMVVPALASAINQGWSTTTAINAMARQPEAAGEMRSALLLALAFMEAITLFSMAVAIVLAFLL
jgi:F-type H+-transporting ATPase subunit c